MGNLYGGVVGGYFSRGYYRHNGASPVIHRYITYKRQDSRTVKMLIFFEDIGVELSAGHFLSADINERINENGHC